MSRGHAEIVHLASGPTEPADQPKRTSPSYAECSTASTPYSACTSLKKTKGTSHSSTAIAQTPDLIPQPLSTIRARDARPAHVTPVGRGHWSIRGSVPSSGPRPNSLFASWIATFISISSATVRPPVDSSIDKGQTSASSMQACRPSWV